MVVVEQKWLYSGKLVAFGNIVSIRANWLYLCI